MRGALADRPVVAVNRLLGAVGGERRGRVIGGWFVWSTGRRLGRSLMDTLRPPGKPFAISKWEVWEAYRQVKANKGAPGADGCSLEDFEKDLKGNLHKIWNRMSSGSYLPPPVLAVEIPKPHGEGTRVLGVPTIADRVARPWWRGGWRRRWSRSSIPTPTATGRAGRRWTRWRSADGAAGRRTG